MDIYEIDNHLENSLDVTFDSGGTYHVASGTKYYTGSLLATIPDAESGSFLGVAANGTQYYLVYQVSGSSLEVIFYDRTKKLIVTPDPQGLVTPSASGYKVQANGIIIIGTSDY